MFLIGAILGLGALGTALAIGGDDAPPKPVVGRQKRRRGKKPKTGYRRAHRPPIRTCEVFPWLGDEIDTVMEAICNEHPGIDARVLAILTLREVYPHTPDGVPVAWPAVSGDCPAIAGLQERVVYRACLHVAAHQDEMAERAWYESGGR